MFSGSSTLSGLQGTRSHLTVNFIYGYLAYRQAGYCSILSGWQRIDLMNESSLEFNNELYIEFCGIIINLNPRLKFV